MAQINARTKGNQFEIYVRNVFRALGYMRAKTSRSCNRELDAAGVDLVGTSHYLVQCKAVERSQDMHKLLDKMPKQPGDMPLVMHKRNRQGTTVTMHLDAFLRLATAYERQKNCPLCASELE